MDNKENNQVEGSKTNNVHGEFRNEHQAILEEKARGLVDFMNQEPKARLIPNLRVTNDGILPDVKLVLLEDNVNTNESNTSEPDPTTEESGEGNTTVSEESDTQAESVSSQG